MLSQLADISVDIESKIKTDDPLVFGKLLNETKFNIPNLVSVTVQLLLVGIAISSFIFLLWGALQWITAGGDKDGVEKARKKITNAIIGLLITLSLFAILALIRVVFGVDLAGDIDIPKI